MRIGGKVLKAKQPQWKEVKEVDRRHPAAACFALHNVPMAIVNTSCNRWIRIESAY